MSVEISTNKNDKYDRVSIRGKPSQNDVFYLTIPNGELIQIIFWAQRALRAKEDFSVMFSGDIKLRHDFSVNK